MVYFLQHHDSSCITFGASATYYYTIFLAFPLFKRITMHIMVDSSLQPSDVLSISSLPSRSRECSKKTIPPSIFCKYIYIVEHINLGQCTCLVIHSFGMEYIYMFSNMAGGDVTLCCSCPGDVNIAVNWTCCTHADLLIWELCDLVCS